MSSELHIALLCIVLFVHNGSLAVLVILGTLDTILCNVM